MVDSRVVGVRRGKRSSDETSGRKRQRERKRGRERWHERLRRAGDCGLSAFDVKS